jgi:DnaJ-class molecular chaperone
MLLRQLKNHPDRNSSPAATKQFQEIANAYHVLSDTEKRQKYDTENAIAFDPVDPIKVFAEIFNDLMIPEVPNPSYWYQPLGTAAGAMFGFIVLNVPGAFIGGYYGNRAGKVRDMKGVSVYEAFSKLSTEKRNEILGSLSKKFLSAAIKS